MTFVFIAPEGRDILARGIAPRYGLACKFVAPRWGEETLERRNVARGHGPSEVCPCGGGARIQWPSALADGTQDARYHRGAACYHGRGGWRKLGA